MDEYNFYYRIRVLRFKGIKWVERMSKVDNDFMTTTEACEVLGVSKTVIKRMADSGELDTWKTPGGHRRLKRSAVLEIAENKMGGVRKGKKRTNAKVGVMVMDDDPVMIELFAGLLASIETPTELVTAQDGYEALVKAGQQDYDIIFVDLNMPRIDGYEAIHALKQSDRNKDATIMVITATKESDIEYDRLPKDVVCLTKPLNMQVIKQFIRYEYRLKS